jgi:hypothetical protein
MDLPTGTSLLACCPWLVSGSCGWWLSGWWSCDGSPPDQRQHDKNKPSQTEQTDQWSVYYTFNQPDNSVCFHTVLGLRPWWSRFYCRELFLKLFYSCGNFTWRRQLPCSSWSVMRVTRLACLSWGTGMVTLIGLWNFLRLRVQKWATITIILNLPVSIYIQKY